MKIKPAILYYSLASLFWLLLWQVAAKQIGKELFLPTPIQVFTVLVTELLPSKSFWVCVLSSFLRIGAGFLSGLAAGVSLAVASHCCEPVKILLWLPIKVIKAVPVASFVILTLLWMDSSMLAVFIPFLMVLPILYLHTLTALSQTDQKLIEMARLFHIPFLNQLSAIYLPHIFPSVLSACSLAAGMAWKSGIAAEIIGLSRNSVGNKLYQAKIYLLTPELFAWTIVIVLLSIGWEQLFKLLSRLIESETSSIKRS